jgi:hypothetical protein
MTARDELARRYADPEARAAFEEDDGQEVEVFEVVPGPVGEVFDAWLQDVWVAGGTTVRDGKGRGRVGHIRKLGGTGIVEEIVSVGLPQDNSVQADRPSSTGRQIASVAYRMNTLAPFLLDTHRGFVRFVPTTSSAVDASGRQREATFVVWSVKTTPTSAGGVLCCGGSIQRVLMRNVFQRELKVLAAAMRQRAALA